LAAEAEMTEAVRRPDQRWTVANDGVRDPDAVRGPAKLHLAQGGRCMPRLRLRRGRVSIVRDRRRAGSNWHERRLPQRARAYHVELVEPLLRSLKMLVGLAPAAGGTQQSNQCGMGRLIGGIEQAERPRVAQGFLRRALEPRY